MRIRDVTFHWSVFLLAAAVIAGSFLFSSTDNGGLRLTSSGRILPELCVFRRNLHVPCPGCGLTRSFVRMARGDLVGAWHFNFAGPLLFALAVFQIPYRYVQVRRIRQGRSPLLLGRPATLFVWVVVILLFVRWLMVIW